MVQKVLKKKLTVKKKTRVVNEAAVESPLSVTKNKIIEFLALHESERIAIISDDDQDGITAAVQMHVFLLKNKVESKIFFYDRPSNKLNVPMDEFIKFNPVRTIFLDINEAVISDLLVNIGKLTGPFVIIDHHEPAVVRNNSFRCMVVKPKNFSELPPSKYPTSKMVHDLFGGTDWLCAIGVLGDFAFDVWKSFLLTVAKKHKLSYKKLEDLEGIVGCIASQHEEKIGELVAFLIAAKNPRELLASDFASFKKLYDQKIATFRERFYKEAECYEDVGVCFFCSEARMTSKLSNIISVENPHKLICVYSDAGDRFKVSIRRQDQAVDCNVLAQYAVANSSIGKGGGHVPAAGAAFDHAYLAEFKQRVRLYLLENPPKIKK